MKKFLILFAIVVPGLSFASVYSCHGDGFSIDLTDGPLEMKIKGTGINVLAQDIHVTTTFNTVVTGNVANPATTVKLSIKDSQFGYSGDRFKAALQFSSAAGIRNYAGLVCIRGNE